MNKLIVFGVLGLLLFGGGLFLSNSFEDKVEEKQYHGPVRPTDNLQHFRETGETIKEAIE